MINFPQFNWLQVLLDSLPALATEGEKTDEEKRGIIADPIPPVDTGAHITIEHDWQTDEEKRGIIADPIPPLTTKEDWEEISDEWDREFEELTRRRYKHRIDTDSLPDAYRKDRGISLPDAYRKDRGISLPEEFREGIDTSSLYEEFREGFDPLPEEFRGGGMYKSVLRDPIQRLIDMRRKERQGEIAERQIEISVLEETAKTMAKRVELLRRKGGTEQEIRDLQKQGEDAHRWLPQRIQELALLKKIKLGESLDYSNNPEFTPVGIFGDEENLKPVAQNPHRPGMSPEDQLRTDHDDFVFHGTATLEPLAIDEDDHPSSAHLPGAPSELYFAAPGIARGYHSNLDIVREELRRDLAGNKQSVGLVVGGYDRGTKVDFDWDKDPLPMRKVTISPGARLLDFTSPDIFNSVQEEARASVVEALLENSRNALPASSYTRDIHESVEWEKAIEMFKKEGLPSNYEEWKSNHPEWRNSMSADGMLWHNISITDHRIKNWNEGKIVWEESTKELHGFLKGVAKQRGYDGTIIWDSPVMTGTEMQNVHPALVMFNPDALAELDAPEPSYGSKPDTAYLIDRSAGRMVGYDPGLMYDQLQEE